MLETIVLAAMLAYIVTYVVDYIKAAVSAVVNKDWSTAMPQAAALVLSIAGCCSMGLDIFSAVGVYFGYPIVGIVLTGLVVSRGANAVYDLIDALHEVKEGAPTEI